MSENKSVLAIQKSRTVLLDILSTRGYNTDEYKGFSLTEVHALFLNNQLDILLENPIIKKKVYIKYYLEKTIKPANIHDLIEDLYNIEEILNPIDELMIIIKDEPNDTLEKLQTSIFEHDKYYINIMNIERLQFNILNHSYVPHHKVLNQEEYNMIKLKYDITEDSNFPAISRFDPVAHVLGLRPGELCEITRSSKTAITAKHYRLCSQ